MKTIFFFAICAVLLVSCSPNNKESSVVCFEKIIDSKSNVNLSDIANEVIYVPLESAKDALLGNIQKIIIVGERIYISDLSSVGSRLLLFDIEGKFIKQIGSIGNGPGEYGQISDICLVKDKKEIQIVANNKKNILRYNLEGNFVGNGFEINDDVTVQYFNGRYYSHYPSNMLFYNKVKEFQLTVRNLSGDIINYQYPVDKTRSSYLNPFIEFATFSQNDGTCFYHVPKDNVLYQIQDSAIVSKIIYSFGKYSFPSNFIWNYNNIQKAKSMDLAFIQSIKVAANFIFIEYKRQNKKGLIIKAQHKYYNTGEGDFIGIKDDIDGCGYLADFWVQDSILLNVITPYNIPDSYRIGIPFSKKVNNLFSIIQGDNYIVRIVKVKKILKS